MATNPSALDSLTFAQYYSAFKEHLSGVAALVAGVLPLGSLLKDRVPIAALLFPPLGDVENVSRYVAVLLAFIATYLAFFRKGDDLTKIRRTLYAVAGLAFVLLCAYILVYSAFVRRIDIPTRNASVLVSVGYQRSSFARNNFSATTDWELLRQRGFDDDQIEKLWTPKSVTTARFLLFFTYCGALISFVLMFSLGVIWQLHRSAAVSAPVGGSPLSP
jgi:hypothetical protein